MRTKLPGHNHANTTPNMQNFQHHSINVKPVHKTTDMVFCKSPKLSNLW